MPVFLSRTVARGAQRAFVPPSRPGGPIRIATITNAEINELQVYNTPLGEKLHEGRVWRPRAKAKKVPTKDGFHLHALDGKTVNIVSEKLCDDIIERLGPSLERHKGCDIIDLNPGASLWSRALHDAVQPRRHIMMESTAKETEPFRNEIMGDRKIEVIPKSGLSWENMNSVLKSHLDPYFQRLKRGEQPTKQDSLLVTANLSSFPKKKQWNFDSIMTLIFYQLMTSLRQSSYFQQYGCIRMLVWLNDDVKTKVVPRSCLWRKRMAFEAELSCEWIHEVAGGDVARPQDIEAGHRSDAVRDQWIDYESAAKTLRRMKDNNITTPSGRESTLLKFILNEPSLQDRPLSGTMPPHIHRPSMTEMETLEQLDPSVRTAQDTKRFNALRDKHNFEASLNGQALEIIQMHDKALTMDLSSPEFADVANTYEKHMASLTKTRLGEIKKMRDHHHLFRHSPKEGLFWDRRHYEPLIVDPLDFYPAVPICLLDIQPKPGDPLLRQHGPTTSRSADYAGLILRSLFWNRSRSLDDLYFDGIWPGYAEQIRNLCPSLTDPTKGGLPFKGDAGLNMRLFTETHFLELLNAWMVWPFKPTYPEILARLVETDDWVDADEGEETTAEESTTTEQT